jgi:hypothetical protein
LEFERDVVKFPEFESAAAAVEFIITKFGPLMMARQMTEATGRWDELYADLLAMAEREDPAEYLVVLGRKRER